MAKIAKIRPVLLTAPYGNEQSLEVILHLPFGLRNCGLVEITLEDGTIGLGEAYLAVFAPQVFTEMVNVISPYLIGCDILDLNQQFNRMVSIVGYWGLKGPARHVLGAFEMAMTDAKAKLLEIPAYALLGTKGCEKLSLYGSGGDSVDVQSMHQELDSLQELGIDLFKIRARNDEVAKTVWVLEKAAARGIRVGVDMCQNLAIPSQTVSDVLKYLDAVKTRTANDIVFLEEVLGPFCSGDYKVLRRKCDVKICGGETITTSHELCELVREGIYDFVQPDASVLGGISEVLQVFDCAAQYGCDVVVHAWSGGVGLMANYHAAIAGGALLAEWPMPKYSLREELLIEPLNIQNGQIEAPQTPGLGVILTEEIEKKYPFTEKGTYRCIPTGYARPGPEIWQ